MNLSIIILSYKSKDHLKVLLPSIWASEGIEFESKQEYHPVAFSYNKRGNTPAYFAEVIIVDNDSQDGTAEWVEEEIRKLGNKEISLIRNENNGFAKGNNLGIKRARGRYVLLLNPDTEVMPDTFKVMLDFMEARQDVGMATCKIMKPDGRLDRAARRNFPNPWNALLRFFKISWLIKNQNFTYNYSDATADQEMEIQSLVGAFCLTRRSVIDKIGLLDESFFMYGEDLDWCWRCHAAGWKIWYYPKTHIIHYKGESSKKAPFRSLKVFHDAMWIFYKKYYAQQYPFFFNWLVWLGIYSRLAMLTVLNLFKKKRIVSR